MTASILSAPGAPIAREGDAGRRRLVAGLTLAQRAAVETSHEPLCVLAGAGSGKTTVLTTRVARRILDGSADAEHVMVLTFTRKAAGEVRRRLARLGIPGRVRAGTFHAAAYAQLRQLWSERGERPPALIDDPARVLRGLLDGIGIDDPAPEVVSRLLGEIHWARVKLISPARYPEAARAARRTGGHATNLVAEVYALYCEDKRRRGLIDVDDLLDECASAIEGDPEQAKRRRWWVRHLFIDEFQDLNPAQWRLLEAWRGGREDLFVVGDPLQAVYGWNGSDPTFIERFVEFVPGALVLELDENHRSSPQVVAVARALFERRGPDDQSTNHGEPGACAKVSSREGPPPLLTGFDTDEAEAISVAGWLRRAHKPGRAWSHLAVLARTNARLEKVAKALRQFGIPHRLGPASVVEPAMTDALALLRRTQPSQPLRNALAQVLASLQEVAASTGEQYGVGAGAGSIPSELQRLVEEHAEEEPGATVGAFLTWLSATAGDDEFASGDTDRVELTTFHRAKGLEWRAVAVIGLEEGLVPTSYASSDADIDEERRLLYVAITRAEEELWCSWAAECTRQGRTWSSQASPFLEPVQRAIETLNASYDVESGRAKVTELRSKLLMPL